MKTLRDRLVDTTIRRYTSVDIPGIGDVRLQSLTEREYSEVETSEQIDARAVLVCYTVVDEDGNRVFANEEVSTVAAMDYAIVNRIAEAAFKHSRSRVTELDAAKN